jgi:hypothetical protein
MIEDKQKISRQRLFLRGFIRTPQSGSNIDCIVRDISETGAKLRFRCAPFITEFFELHIPSKEQIVQSKLVWIDGCEVGGLTFRRCQLSWVNGDTLGVHFLKPGEQKTDRGQRRQ